ncbi:MAG: hypothetical protein A3B30_00635 [Candidatus Komeilibacteria bacterium RIFCSPLOWO2_01_FULL_52_15]|uniref:Lipoprotein n=2 Tax=Candidatus Komeiliibacteriota TaxID=1817908 RepID=A0A1G2BQ34_9BACT|nr:MAG: hypothetical protein A2677_03075 [Candidatus Komeilibacteria bacterium RIFCSPHIGHO2_01_FULL_52_14]OGY91208.1 MAG: hypothetical protein A3B30_00635 [Candidatus Komeilibacteria bacterium RIFCSPLOWO2_01_FULL_52_15]
MKMTRPEFRFHSTLLSVALVAGIALAVTGMGCAPAQKPRKPPEAERKTDAVADLALTPQEIEALAKLEKSPRIASGTDPLQEAVITTTPDEKNSMTPSGVCTYGIRAVYPDANSVIATSTAQARCDSGLTADDRVITRAHRLLSNSQTNEFVVIRYAECDLWYRTQCTRLLKTQAALTKALSQEKKK